MKHSLFYQGALMAGLLALGLGAQEAKADMMSLDGFSQYGSASAGNWQVSADGKSVVQTINGAPTYYLSDKSSINQEYAGRFLITGSDDDWVGFVFGFTGMDNFYLFDWKARNQDSAYEGFRLMKVTNPSGLKFSSAVGAGVELIASSYGAGLGWRMNTAYDYLIGYTADRITISLNGGAFNFSQIFDVGGLDNEAGQYGFYNYSQGGVTYFDASSGTCIAECGSSQNLQGIQDGTYNLVDANAPAGGLAAFAALGLALLRVRRSK